MFAIAVEQWVPVGAILAAASRCPDERPGKGVDMSEELLRGYTVSAEHGPPGKVSGVLASKASTNGSLTLISSRLEGGPPRPTHLYEDGSFYLLAGALLWSVATTASTRVLGRSCFCRARCRMRSTRSARLRPC